MCFSLRNSLFISTFAKTYFLAYGKTTYIPIVKMERQSRKEATHTGRCKTSWFAPVSCHTREITVQKPPTSPLYMLFVLDKELKAES